jgi:hypothetical protein
VSTTVIGGVVVVAFSRSQRLKFCISRRTSSVPDFRHAGRPRRRRSSTSAPRRLCRLDTGHSRDRR